MLLHNHVLGVAGSVYFKDRDAAEPEPGNIEHHFGLLHHDLAPKPAYAAMATLTRLVGEARVRGTLALGVGEHAVVFRARRERVVALWAEAGGNLAPARAAPTGPGARARRRGRDAGGLGRGSLFTLAPDDGPIYVLGPIALRPRTP